MTSATHGDGTLRPPPGASLLPAGLLPDGARVAVVASRYHSEVVQRLLDGACDVVRSELGDGRADIVPVPGAFELGTAARVAAASGRYAAVVALGCVVRGETPHFDYVAGEAARGVAMAAESTGVPVGFGVVTVEDADQAFARAGGAAGNKGAEAASAALELARTLAALPRPA